MLKQNLNHTSYFTHHTSNKGITLIALIITIILILILASITVTVAINGGLFNYAGKAKQNTEIASEKETVQKASILAENTSKTGRITTGEMQKAINSITEENVATAIDNGETIVVKFNKSNRYYEIDSKGNVEGPKELVKDEYAGDITKGGTCTGSASNPYQISCIEDLVAFSKLINNNEINQTSTVILMRTLDFKSIFSYDDYEAKYSYDETTNSYIKDENSEKTLMELCTKDQGFIPIGKSANDTTARFRGTFDGQGFEIQNIYINISGNAGLFGGTFSATINNLGISGNITSTGGYAGGIVAHGVSTSYYKCYNKANVKGKGYTGGLVGHGSWAVAVTSECVNYGEITSENGYTGGLAGSYAGKIVNSHNEGNVKSQNLYAGGILGQSAGKITITNCYNSGHIESGTYPAKGIIADVYAETIVNNCYNEGDIEVKEYKWDAYSAASGLGGTTVTNSYNAGNIIDKHSQSYEITSGTTNNCYYFSNLESNGEIVGEGTIDISEKTTEEFVELLNSYTDDTGTYPSDWKRWKVGENGYPVFE